MKLHIIPLILLFCVLVMLKILHTVATDGRKAPGGFGPTIHERAYIDTIAEQSLEAHPAINMAWVEYDSANYQWYAWVKGKDVDIERRYCESCRDVLIIDMMKSVERATKLRRTRR